MQLNRRFITSAAPVLVIAIVLLGALLFVQQRSLGDTNTNPNAGGACPAARYALAAAYGSKAALVAAFVAPAPVVAAWQEKDRGSNAPHVAASEWRAHPAAELVSVCYFDGTFDHLALPGGPPAGGVAAPTVVVDRIVVLIGQNGRAALYSAGPQTLLQIEDPSVP